MSLKRRPTSPQDSVDLGKVSAESFVFDFPSVLEFCCLPQWPEGGARSLGTIMLIFDPPVWKLWVHDRDSSASCFVSGETLEAAFRALEKLCTDGGGDWRPDKPGRGRAK